MRVGDIIPSWSSGNMEVVEIVKGSEYWKHKVKVRFEDGVEIWSGINNVREGRIWNKNTPYGNGVGIIGYGEYEFWKDKLAYDKWAAMLTRAHSETFKLKNPEYRDCTASESWKYFQKFAPDFYNMHGHSNKGWQLDKDILVKGNKHYSFETCCLVPQAINCLTLRKHKVDKPTPRGVETFGSKYGVRDRSSGKSVWLIKTTSIKEAYYVHKAHHEGKIKKLANEWKSELDGRVYEALMNYEVDELEEKEIQCGH